MSFETFRNTHRMPYHKNYDANSIGVSVVQIGVLCSTYLLCTTNNTRVILSFITLIIFPDFFENNYFFQYIQVICGTAIIQRSKHSNVS